MKRKLSLLLAVVMILGSFSFAFAADVDPVEFLEENDILKGDISGDLMLDEPLLRRDAVVLLSRLLGVEEEAEAFEEEGLPTFNDLTDNKYYRSVIAWAESNGYYTGNPDGSFGYLKNQTAKEYAIVLLRALGYGNDDKKVEWDNAWELAKELDLLANVEAEANDEIARRVIAQMTYNALGTTLKDSEETLAEKLGIDMPVPEVVEATKVADVYADNLKEIKVKFDGEVDKASAELKDNYTLDKGEITNAVLSEDLTEVVLTVKDKMDNQKERELTVRNIKAADKTLATETKKFMPVDKQLPEVVSVEALGNKAVKVTFSEPVQNGSVTINGFKVDGKAVAGTIDKNDGRVVIIKLYSKLADGSHKLSVSGVKDFADYIIITNEYDFEVVEDKEAPAIESVEATLEYVTVKFTEPVQDSTVKGGSYAYWKATETTTVKNNSATTKPERLADDTYRFDFASKPLPGYPVYLYIEGVKDYSDNTIAKDTPVLVEAKIDQTRPEVTVVKVADDNKSIEVKFTKSIRNITDKSNYTLLNEKDKNVSIRRVSSADSKVAKIELYNALEEGTYTLKIQGLTDNTALRNAIMPYETALEVKDSTQPEVTSVSANGNKVYIQFNKEMAIDGEFGVTNLNNYFINYGTTNRSLPSGTSVEVLSGGKTVLLIMGDIDNKDFDAGKLNSITVQKVKDINGNQLLGYSQEISNFAQDFKATKATLKDSKTITVKFNQNIGDKIGSDIIVDGLKSGNAVTDFSWSGDTVTLTLKDDEYATAQLKVIVAAKSFKSVTEKEVEGITLDGANFKDEVAPELASEDELVVVGNTIEIEFTEAIATSAYMAGDFKVVRAEDNKVLASNVDYEAQASGNKVIITLKGTGHEGYDSVYTVELIGNVFVKDMAENAAVKFDAMPTKDSIKGAKVAEAEAAVEKAETSKLKIDKDAAEALVKALPENSEARKVLLARVNAIVVA